MRVFDLTPVIDSKLAVFPGDVAYQRDVSMDFKTGSHLQLSSFRTTFHLGAHADSSSHYHAEGAGVQARTLQTYMGNAQVLHVSVARGERIQLEHLAGKKIQAPRVLFFTGTFPDPQNWNSDFASLSPEVIEDLHQRGVRLVGIDTPSVDPETSKGLESHQALYRTKMAVLEGLVLAHVPEGVYTLSALPLPFRDADASPVRAILIDRPGLLPEEDWDVL